MMIAFDADASSTSVSVIAPTPECSTRILTLSFDSFCSVSVSTSAEPPTSVLRMMWQFLDLAFLHLLVQLFEREAAGLAPCAASRALASR